MLSVFRTDPLSQSGTINTSSSAGALPLRSLRLRHARLHVPREMRHDSHHSFHQHQLAAMMHFMFFYAPSSYRSGFFVAAFRPAAS